MRAWWMRPFVVIACIAVIIGAPPIIAAPVARPNTSDSASMEASDTFSIASTPSGVFDLSSLGSVLVESREGATRGWFYVFNAAGTVDMALTRGRCHGKAPAPALQITDGACHALGNLAQRSVDSFIDAGRVGVKITFRGGDKCGALGERTISIHVVCADADRQESVQAFENATQACTYIARLESRAGCPRECPRDPTTRAVCGGEGRGMCTYRLPGGNSAGCLCARHHSGPVCTLETSQSHVPRDSVGAVQVPSLPVIIFIIAMLSILSFISPTLIRGPGLSRSVRVIISILCIVSATSWAALQIGMLPAAAISPRISQQARRQCAAFEVPLTTSTREAYILYASNERRHFVQALAAVMAIRKVDRNREIVLLRPSQHIDADILVAFAHERVETRELEPDVTSKFSNLFDTPLKCDKWKSCWVKFFVFSLTEFRNIVVVDNDYLLLRPIELAFKVADPYTIAAVEDMVMVFHSWFPTGRNEFFNAGLWGARPSTQVFEDLVAFAEQGEAWGLFRGDQIPLNDFFQTKGTWMRLPTTYNIFPHNVETMLRRLDRGEGLTLDRIHGLHFTWRSKPVTELGPNSTEADCKMHADIAGDHLPSCLLWIASQRAAEELLVSIRAGGTKHPAHVT